MRIVLVGTAYPLRGGIAHYVALLWKYLSRTHDVRIVTFSRQYPKLLFPGKSQEESGDAGIPVESVQWIDSINPFNWIRTGFRVRALRPDLIVFKYWMPFFAPSYGTIAAIARWGTSTRTMFICDNIIPHERRPGDKLLTRFAFRFVDSYVVQSRAVERDLHQWHPDPLTSYLPHPVYEIFGEEEDRTAARGKLRSVDPSMELTPDDRVMLFFGYVRDYKGLDVALDAMPAILEQMKVKLLVVGEFYNNEEKYREQVRRLGVGKYVFFHSDYVPNEEVGVFFSAADVLTLPYKSATQSGIIQIAYNFHRPVIATDVGGLGEVIVDGKTGAIVPPENPAAIAAAVTDFFAHDRFTEYRANVIEEKKKYSWEHMAEGIEELYHRSIQKRRS
ncbi:MAG: glycosyltransferase [Bacteroidetes bacterium]|nr:glycosyltransferase [Bacteroidota bacterium]